MRGPCYHQCKPSKARLQGAVGSLTAAQKPCEGCTALSGQRLPYQVLAGLHSAGLHLHWCLAAGSVLLQKACHGPMYHITTGHTLIATSTLAIPLNRKGNITRILRAQAY